MPDANADKSAKPDESATPASSPPATSPDKLLENLDVKVSEEEQNKVTGGMGKGMYDWIKA